MSYGRNGYEQMDKIFRIHNDTSHDICGHLWSLYWLVRMVRAKKVVELGIREGNSTRALLAGCMDTDGRLHSIDLNGNNYNVEEHSRRHGIDLNFDLWTVESANSIDAGEKFSGSCDMVFVDTDHSFYTTRREIDVWNNHVRRGGVMVFHDTWCTHPGQDGVKNAIEAFYCQHHRNGWAMELRGVCYNNDYGLGILWKL